MSRLKQQASERANELLKSYNVKINPDTGTYRLVNKSTGKEESVADSGVEVGTSIFAKGRRANKLIGRNLVQASAMSSPVVQPTTPQPSTQPTTSEVDERESYTTLKRRPTPTLTAPQSFVAPKPSIVVRPLPSIDNAKYTAMNNDLKAELNAGTEAENKTAAEDEMFNKFLQEQYSKLPDYRKQRLSPEEYAKYSGYSKTSPEFSSYSKNFESQKRLLSRSVPSALGPTPAQQAARDFFKRILFNPTGLPYPVY